MRNQKENRRAKLPRGWRKIYRYALLELKKLDLPASFRITAVHETDGSLTVEYRDAGDKEAVVRKILSALKKQSASTCRDCGRQGRLCNLGGYSLTLCHHCFNKYYGDVSAGSSEAVYLAEKMKSWFRWYY